MPTQLRSTTRPRRITLDGRDAMLVPLKGRIAKGRRLILDREVYEALTHRYANKWVLSREGTGEAVTGRLRPVGKRPNEGTNPKVKLARLITSARPDQRVGYINGSALDLRRVNLRLTPVPAGASLGRPLPDMGAFRWTVEIAAGAETGRDHSRDSEPLSLTAVDGPSALPPLCLPAAVGLRDHNED